MVQKIRLLIVCFLANISFTFAQTVSITLQDAETRFLNKNLLLLAERYNIDAAKAQVMQARLFDNPNISFEQNIYNSRNGKYFDLSSEGETAIEIEQVIYLAGKRGKRIDLEKRNAEMAAYQLEETLRELRNALRTNFVELFYFQKSISIYDKEISNLQHLVDVYEKQYEKGNISHIEKSRLKALLFSLQNEKTNLLKEQTTVQKELNLLLNHPAETTIRPVLDIPTLQHFSFQEMPFSTLLNEIQNRPDLKIVETGVRSADANLRLQKSMRVPNLNVKGIWDKDGNFIHNYFAIGLSIDLPVFNRNQGNIKTAQAQLNQSKSLYENHQNKATNELHAIYKQVEESLLLYQKFDDSIEKDFNQLIIGVTENFERRNISMLEFIDYYETYKETCIQLYEVEKNVLLSIENLNYIIGKNIFHVIQ